MRAESVREKRLGAQRFVSKLQTAIGEGLFDLIQGLGAESSEIAKSGLRALRELLNGADTGMDERIECARREVEDFNGGVALLHRSCSWLLFSLRCRGTGEVCNELWLHKLLVRGEVPEVALQQLGCELHGFLCGEGPVRLDIQVELLQICALTHAS